MEEKVGQAGIFEGIPEDGAHNGRYRVTIDLRG